MGPESSRGRGLSDPRAGATSDYDVAETGFDAVSSIGLTEHRRQNYRSTSGFSSQLRTGGLLLNHCITRHDNRSTSFAGQVHRPLRFPDEADRLRTYYHRDQQVGLEVLHGENFRHHYAMTLRDWLRQRPHRTLG